MIQRRALWLAAGLGAVVLVAAGASGLRAHEPSCARAAEIERPLDLHSAADRAHLQQDLADVDAVALAFSEEVARRPVLGDSIDARASAKTAPARARFWCGETLRAEVARVHRLPSLPPRD